MRVIEWFVRFSGWTTLLVVSSAFLVIVAAFLYAQFQNNTFASRFFDQQRVGKFNVLASKGLHFSTFGCTYAIIQSDHIPEFDERFRETLSAFANSKRSSGYWPLPKDWRRTPFQAGNWNPRHWNFETERVNEGVPGYFAHCLYQAIPDDPDAMLKAITSSGGWFGVSGEAVAFVLPSLRVSGMVRYGD